MKASTRKKTKKLAAAPLFQTSADVKSALLIVSLLINLFVFCLWIAVYATDKYDAALMQFLFNR